MNKKLKSILYIVIVLVIGYFVQFYFRVAKPSHSFNKHMYKNYMWILKDSARREIEPLFCYSYVQKHDVYNGFHFKGNYLLIVWEFKNLRNLSIEKVAINSNIYLGDVKFGKGEILNDGSYLPITIKSTYSFKNLMNIDVGTDSRIEKQIKGANYKGFYGKIKRMALRNASGGDHILFNYVQGPTPTVVLVYKGHHSFFLIVINHIYKPLNPDIIKILNLK